MMRQRLVLLLALLFFGLSCPAGADGRVYVLAAPYFTVTDEIPLAKLKRFLAGYPTREFPGLRMTQETLDDISSRYFVRSGAVEVTEAAEWEEHPDCFWMILPFETLDPRMKVIAVNGSDPLDFGFDQENYALTITLPEGVESNFDPEKLTSLTLTGTTAMSRRLAAHMNTEGILMPAEIIGETLAASDITHISNESSFFTGCYADSPEARFCSDPSYFALLETVGADVVELTGNHNLDWGVEPYLFSLGLYESAGIRTYGGGYNEEDAARPLLIEHHGNRIALLGCNDIGPEGAWAGKDSPGALRCDIDRMKEQIEELKKEGWLPVVTLQGFEWPDHATDPLETHDFYELAEAGPVIVSGSQAHIPQGMTFVGETFIHFGLGNTFFDQMSDMERKAFFDRHYFYDGRYIGNSLETIILENESQPRFLTSEEREAFLQMIFATCPAPRGN